MRHTMQQEGTHCTITNTGASAMGALEPCIDAARLRGDGRRLLELLGHLRPRALELQALEAGRDGVVAGGRAEAESPARVPPRKVKERTQRLRATSNGLASARLASTMSATSLSGSGRMRNATQTSPPRIRAELPMA
eukprot:4223152-Pleurochrysis_carterae.AAC.5